MVTTNYVIIETNAHLCVCLLSFMYKIPDKINFISTEIEMYLYCNKTVVVSNKMRKNMCGLNNIGTNNKYDRIDVLLDETKKD